MVNYKFLFFAWIFLLNICLATVITNDFIWHDESGQLILVSDDFGLSETVDIVYTEEEIFLENIIVSKHVFRDDKHKCVVEVPSDWEPGEATGSFKALYYYPDPQDLIYVGLQIFYYPQLVTANTVYAQRSGGVWDRWLLLGHKEYSHKDSFLIGSDEKISALYQKQELNIKLQTDKTIVAEDIYIKNKKFVYVVTAFVPEKRWIEFKDIIKEIMNSFYIEE